MKKKPTLFDMLSQKFPKLAKVICDMGLEKEIFAGFDKEKAIKFGGLLYAIPEKSSLLVEKAAIQWLHAMSKASQIFMKKVGSELDAIFKQEAPTKSMTKKTKKKVS